ncbi:MAG: hypothetical protein A3F12_06165 [Gammaproteobacteria bacterium RIFCSPHIGHO2_12_FULL_38_14]|nr:MAG: hypothetical protein A3F12_06165 [Gammaproteobacteria bacterium RIFCSPHIGHO2_12_FULL_38_14]
MMHTDTRYLDLLGPNPKWVAFVQDEYLRSNLVQIAAKMGIPHACVQTGDLTSVRAFFNSGVEPLLLVLELSQSLDLSADVKSLMGYAPTEIRIIIIGKEDHVSIFRKLRQLGVVDYLVLPVEENVLRNAINMGMVANVAQDIQDFGSKPFTIVLGVRGGIGVSTLCTNFAWLTASFFQKKVCLIDFNFYQGTICLLLDLVRNMGLNEALTEIERLDEVFLKHILIQKEENFSILTGQAALEQEIAFSQESIKILVTFLKERFDFIYADLNPVFYSMFTQTILNAADKVIFVADYSLISIQNLLHMKTFFATYMPHLKNKIIINDVFPHKSDISKSMFEKSVEAPVDATLPYCKASMFEKMDAGEVFVKTYSHHEYTVQLKKLLTELYPQLQPVKKLSWFEKWRSKRK